MEESVKQTHKLIVHNRKFATVSGVNDVLSFDITEILLETEQGMLLIKGNDLHVKKLTLEKGEVDIEGKIDSFTYSELISEHRGGRIMDWKIVPLTVAGDKLWNRNRGTSVYICCINRSFFDCCV